MTTELAEIPRAQQIINVTEAALSIEQIVAQRKLIKRCMAEAMEEGQHYGKIPGCGDKPTLLQPGAQLLAHLFRLRPEYEIIETDLPGTHKRFRVNCRLFVMGSIPPIPISEGVGESSSMESKHRFRNAAKEIRWTTDPVPAAYWNLHNQDKGDNGNRAKEWLKASYEGANMGTKKNDQGDWVFVEYLGGNDEKVENANPPDVFNTVLKIAKKRAYVDATITATASSDFFTQDLEDIRENIDAVKTEKAANATVVESGEKKSAPEAGKPAGNWGDVICTYGKKNGPLRGKKLGDLNDDSLKYLADIFLAEGKVVKDGDRKMVAALAIWQASKRKVTPTAGGDGGLAEDQIQFNGKNHEDLYKQLIWDGIKPSDFIDAMKSVKVLPENAKDFRLMSEETAKSLLADWDNAKAVVKEFVEVKAKGAK